MFSAFTLALALSALLVEALIGYPAPVYARLRHPVTWIGALIARLEQMLNRPELVRRPPQGVWRADAARHSGGGRRPSRAR